MKKKFDCIEMKREIQNRMLTETKMMNDSERIEFYRNAIKKNVNFSKYIKKISSLNTKGCVSLS